MLWFRSGGDPSVYHLSSHLEHTPKFSCMQTNECYFELLKGNFGKIDGVSQVFREMIHRQNSKNFVSRFLYTFYKYGANII